MDVDDREELAALAEQLRGPMNAQAQRLRQHLKGTIIPAIQQIKQVHDKMEDEGEHVLSLPLSGAENELRLIVGALRYSGYVVRKGCPCV